MARVQIEFTAAVLKKEFGFAEGLRAAGSGCL